MKPLILFPHEVRRLADVGTVTVWRPIEPQPPAYINDLHGGELSKRAPYTLEDNETGVIIGVGFFDDDDRPYICPHPPGSERWVKERFGWAVTPKGKSVIVYQADNQARPVLCDNEGEGDCVGVGKKPVEYVAVDGVLWKAAQRMPRWASRLSVTSTAVQARQVQTMTRDEAEAAGMRHGGPMVKYLDFSIWWQSRYGTWHANPWAWATTLTRKDEG